MYAMDYPYQFELYEVDATDDVAIDDEAKKKLFQTNAERVFSLAKG
jgi:2,3-dihydroxybenzoate decarboxylase